MRTTKRRWPDYNHLALDKVPVAACPIPIVYVRPPLGYRASEKPMTRKTLAAATC